MADEHEGLQGLPDVTNNLQLLLAGSRGATLDDVVAAIERLTKSVDALRGSPQDGPQLPTLTFKTVAVGETIRYQMIFGGKRFGPTFTIDDVGEVHF